MAVLQRLLRTASVSVILGTTIYFALLGLLTFPEVQKHVFYLHRVTLTWFKDLNVPEQFGFLHNQVTPFNILTPDGEKLHAWHVLPLELYRRHESELSSQPSGLASDITSRHAFQLLRDDPDARLVLSLHGTSGTIGSGWRPDNYRAIYSASPDNIHVLAVEYRGYGRSSGSPSECGLLNDAIAAAKWAMDVADIPASRIAISGQSLGTAVGIALSEHFASQSPPVAFAGMVLVATFSDVATLTGTYRLGGIVPILSPLSWSPNMLTFFNNFIENKWLSKDRIANFVRTCEESRQEYSVTLIHSEDDADISWLHTEVVFWHAVNASQALGISYEKLQEEKNARKVNLGDAGWVFDWPTKHGMLREQIPKYGLHDKVMSHPIIGMAMRRVFETANTQLEKQNFVQT